MKKSTFHFVASKKTFQLSAVFSLVLVALIVFASAGFFRINKIKEVEKIFKVHLNSVINNSDKYPQRVGHQLLQKSGLAELAIFDTTCSLRYSSSLSITQSDCRLKNDLLYYFINKSGRGEIVIYNFHLNVLQRVKENIWELLLILMSFFLTSSFCLFMFVSYYILKPLDRIRKSISSVDKINDSPNEISFIEDRIFELKKEISEHEKIKISYELAKTIIHDIRNPLASLKLINTNREFVERIDEIEFHIDVLLSKNNYRELSKLDVRKLISSLRRDVEDTFKLSFNVFGVPQSIMSEIRFFELKNILLNLARNSMESKATSFNISFQVNDGKLLVVIFDDGEGVTESQKTCIFKKNYTTKPTGNGIGLSSAKDLLLELGGDIQINTSKVGFSLSLSLPTFPLDELRKIILIDDDKFIRLSWASFGINNSLSITAYATFESFLISGQSHDSSCEIYIDSNLGTKEKGEDAAQLLYMRGFRKIFLATGYANFEKKEYPWIVGVVGKNPNFLI